MENILEVKKLSKKYDGFELKNINIELPKGTIMGFIGENGAGKTTTIKSVLNIIKRDSGEIKIFGFANEIGYILTNQIDLNTSFEREVLETGTLYFNPIPFCTKL